MSSTHCIEALTLPQHCHQYGRFIGTWPLWSLYGIGQGQGRGRCIVVTFCWPPGSFHFPVPSLTCCMSLMAPRMHCQLSQPSGSSPVWSHCTVLGVELHWLLSCGNVFFCRYYFFMFLASLGSCQTTIAAFVVLVLFLCFKSAGLLPEMLLWGDWSVLKMVQGWGRGKSVQAT